MNYIQSKSDELSVSGESEDRNDMVVTSRNNQ